MAEQTREGTAVGPRSLVGDRATPPGIVFAVSLLVPYGLASLLSATAMLGLHDYYPIGGGVVAGLVVLAVGLAKFPLAYGLLADREWALYLGLAVFGFEALNALRIVVWYKLNPYPVTPSTPVVLLVVNAALVGYLLYIREYFGVATLRPSAGS